MKIAFCSDAHLEFSGRNFDFPEADILILAGDIMVFADLYDHENGFTARQFLRDASEAYKKVIYVFGNHELYHGTIQTAKNKIECFLKEENITNIEFGDCGSLIVGDIKFVYATLWTDINKSNPVIMSASPMNDYSQIMILDNETRSGGRYLTPEDTVNIHNEHKEYIEKEVQGFDKVIVVTHHAPSLMSCENTRSSIADYYYCCTDMDSIILDNPQIKYFIHGHLHTRKSYNIGETVVMSWCRGYYPDERMSDSFEIKVFTV